MILNNRSGNSTNYVYAYDDEPEGRQQFRFLFIRACQPFNIPVHTDGPGNLKDFIGKTAGPGSQLQLSETDNALGQTGSITALTSCWSISRKSLAVTEIFIDCSLAYFGFIDVPDDTTNLDH